MQLALIVCAFWPKRSPFYDPGLYEGPLWLSNRIDIGIHIQLPGRKENAPAAFAIETGNLQFKWMEKKKKKFATIAGISFQPSFLVAQEALVPPALSRPVKSFMCIELDFAAGFWPGQKRPNWF